MITITGGPGKSQLVERILTKDTLFLCMGDVAGFDNVPCIVRKPTRMFDPNRMADILAETIPDIIADNTQIVFYSNLCMEHIAPFRDVLQEYETKTKIPVILIYKGNHSAYPSTNEPLSQRERVLADSLMAEAYKSLDELIHLFWSTPSGGEGDIIRVMISNMRKKGFKIECLKGLGYRWLP
jgi:hypothetical protein